MPRAPITADSDVLRALITKPKGKKPKPKKPMKSSDIARAMGLTVYQITARLKGMEGRDLLQRNEGLWSVTYKGIDTFIDPPKEIPKRTKSDGKPVAPTKPSDDDTPRITSMKKSDGWQWRNGWGDKSLNGTIEIHISPKGIEYTEAHPFEKADLLREFPEHPGITPMRLVLWEKSVSFRHNAKAVSQSEQNEVDKELRQIAKRKNNYKKRATKAGRGSKGLVEKPKRKTVKRKR